MCAAAAEKPSLVRLGAAFLIYGQNSFEGKVGGPQLYGDEGRLFSAWLSLWSIVVLPPQELTQGYSVQCEGRMLEVTWGDVGTD